MVLLETETWNWTSNEFVFLCLRVGALALLGLPMVWLLGHWARTRLSKKFTPRQGMLAGKFIFYGGTLLITTMVLQQLGFRLTALLGAAGIAGIAVGFASQTSVSNIIGGLFLIVDNPFTVGEVVKVGDVTGEVMSLGLLSVRIRTFDNKLVRIPNEALVKATVTNFSRFPIRRVDFDISVAYKADLAKVKEILLDVAEKNPLCLAEPTPTLIFSKFGESAIELFLGVWAQGSDFVAVKNSLIVEIKDRFDAEGIEIPYPQIVLNPASGAGPFPVHLTDHAETPKGKVLPSGRKS